MYEFTADEWQTFTKTEQRIIMMLRTYRMDAERIRMVLNWPLSPLDGSTFRGHWARLQKKMSDIRMCRNAQHNGQHDKSAESSQHGATVGQGLKQGEGDGLPV